MPDSRILVIKLGALGDFVQALGPMRAIRDHHRGAEITLLTTPAFEDLALASGTVDQIWIDKRPRFYQIGEWLAARKRLKSANFQRVYDLQTSDRSSFYFRLFSAQSTPEWSGIARGCSHPHANPNRNFMHTQDRQREQLKMAGIDHVPASDLSTLPSDIKHFGLPSRFGLLVPGGAPHRPAKRWPPHKFGELATHLLSQQITPVLLGSHAESELAHEITTSVPEVIDLTGKTSLLDIAAIAKHATIAVGNDTGPMHIAAVAGCPCVVLFSAESDPALCAPRSPKTTLIRRDRLSDLTLADVIDSLPVS